MYITKAELLKQLQTLTPEELQSPVEIRDYANQTTLVAVDFISGQIGVNPEREETETCNSEEHCGDCAD